MEKFQVPESNPAVLASVLASWLETEASEVSGLKSMPFGSALRPAVQPGSVIYFLLQGA